MRIRSFRWHTRWHTLRALAVLPVFGALALAAPARAACLANEGSAILWSHPAQGATDVPTNADLWVMRSDGSGPQRVWLDGAELTRLEVPFNFDLGQLEPNTEYTLEAQGPSADSVLELTFTTGSGPAAADPNAAPGTVTTHGTFEYESQTPLCQTVLNNQGCFDTPPNAYYEFAPSGSAVGWVVHSNARRHDLVWPGECGAPRVITDGSVPCVTLYGIDASGATHAGEEVCAVYPGEGNDLLLPRPTPTGSPGVVLPPASASSDDAEGESASIPPAPAAAQATGCTLPRAPGAGGCSGWAVALLGLVVRWRAARSRSRGTP